MALRLELVENGTSFYLNDAKEDGVNRLLFGSDPKQPLAMNLFQAAREAAIHEMREALKAKCNCEEDELPEVDFDSAIRIYLDADDMRVFIAEGAFINEKGELLLSGYSEDDEFENIQLSIQNVDTLVIIRLTSEIKGE